MKYIYWLVSLTAIFWLKPVSAQGPQFYKEDLSFEIRENYLYVDGLYYFINPSPASLNSLLIYPFPVNDSLYGAADQCRLVNLKDSLKNYIVSVNKKAMSFSVILDPYETGVYRISYRQKLLRKQAEYILLSTLQWGKALETVNYSLLTPVGTEVYDFSIKPDSSYISGSNRVYKWAKENFMPVTDMIFRFR